MSESERKDRILDAAVKADFLVWEAEFRVNPLRYSDDALCECWCHDFQLRCKACLGEPCQDHRRRPGYGG